MVDYCFKWNYADGTPGMPLTEDEARAKDGAGEECTAIMPPREGMTPPVLVTPVWKTGVVVVTFLDAPGRKMTEYTFMKKTDQRLFLTRIHMWTYPNDEPGLRLSNASSHETVSSVKFAPQEVGADSPTTKAMRMRTSRSAEHDPLR